VGGIATISGNDRFESKAVSHHYLFTGNPRWRECRGSRAALGTVISIASEQDGAKAANLPVDKRFNTLFTMIC